MQLLFKKMICEAFEICKAMWGRDKPTHSIVSPTLKFLHRLFLTWNMVGKLKNALFFQHYQIRSILSLIGLHFFSGCVSCCKLPQILLFIRYCFKLRNILKEYQWKIRLYFVYLRNQKILSDFCLKYELEKILP